MITKAEKDQVYRMAVEEGYMQAEQLHVHPQHPSFGQCVAKLEKFLQVPKKFAPTRRYVNRFKLGADPEFVFAKIANPGAVLNREEPACYARMDAMKLNLAQGPAYGADNNGRLAEIRPYPSRSAVEVVASILTTLRWMALLAPVTMHYEWQSGAYLWDDGVGGHVHFGRKRPTRKEEVAALDHIEEGLLALGVYPQDQVLRRRKGDARRQLYGQLGDYRLQQHGYEYRTYPSWLDSPELAFLTLVCSKLAVQVPDLYRFKSGVKGNVAFARIRNFLAYFKAVDDDARLALVLLDRGLPKHIGGDFRPRWGINPKSVPLGKKTGIEVVPLSIKADEESVGEVFRYLREGQPLVYREPKTTWAPVAPPLGYTMCIYNSQTILQKGLGEMIWDVCSYNKWTMQFSSGARGSRFALGFSPQVVKYLPAGWQQMFKGLAYENLDASGLMITIAPGWREGGNARIVKRLLLNGLLPIWSVKDCKDGSYQAWKNKLPKDSIPRKLIGKVVWENVSHKIGPLEGT